MKLNTYYSLRVSSIRIACAVAAAFNHDEILASAEKRSTKKADAVIIGAALTCVHALRSAVRSA